MFSRKEKEDLKLYTGHLADLNSKVEALEKIVKQMDCEHLDQHIMYNQMVHEYYKSCISCKKIIANLGHNSNKLDEEIKMHTEILKRLKEKKKERDNDK